MNPGMAKGESLQACLSRIGRKKIASEFAWTEIAATVPVMIWSALHYYWHFDRIMCLLFDG